jgi:hypothetical protein
MAHARNFTVVVDADLVERARVAARVRGVTLGAVVRKALARLVATTRVQRKGGSDDEDQRVASPVHRIVGKEDKGRRAGRSFTDHK